MRILYALALSSLLFLLAAAGEIKEGKRLIQFGVLDKQWLSINEVETLMAQPGIHNWMDVTDFEYKDYYAPQADIPIPSAPRFQEVVQRYLPDISIGFVTTNIDLLGRFNTRYYTSSTGVEAANWVYEKFREYANGAPNVTVTRFYNTNYPQPSVIAVIPGTGFGSENVVILGAHLDSRGSTTTGRSPGADDDASGTASILEIFRILVARSFQNQYTIHFIAYSGEEAGLLGSQAIAADYVKRQVPVYAVMQMDMTGYNRNNRFTVGTVTDFTSAELNAFVSQLITTYTTLNQANYVCGYACSDHASWNRTGFRSSFPFETPYGSNPQIHTQNDVLSLLDPNQMSQFVNLGLSFAIELAGMAPQQ